MAVKQDKEERWRALKFPRSIKRMVAQHPDLAGDKVVGSIGPVLLSMWVMTPDAELYDGEEPGTYLLVVEPDRWEQSLCFRIEMKETA